MIDTENLEEVRMAGEELVLNVAGYFNSPMYLAACDRWENRLRTFLCRPDPKAPVWKSKLQLPSFWLACTALQAQFKQTHSSDPFLFVSLADDANPNPEAKQLVQIAQADLNYDLLVSDFIGKKINMDYYVSIFGTACAREYVRVVPIEKNRKKPVLDETGTVIVFEPDTTVKIRETTETDVIHPLNFAHDQKCSDFNSSDWGAVRFVLPLIDVFSMVGNDDYYQPGIKEVLEKTSNGSYGGYSNNSNTFYSDDDLEPAQSRRRQIVVWEYSGPMWFKGNEGDETLYYALYVPEMNTFLRLGKSPFSRHPFWKCQTYPNPTGPYGVGPCDMMRPINMWETNMVNQYNDYVNSAMKYLYKVFPGHIAGGVSALLNGLPGGLVEAAEAEYFDKMIEPVKNDRSGMPPMQDVLNLIYKYKDEVRPSSNGKQANPVLDTATGVSFVASREDDATAAIQEGIDRGIQDGMMLKFENMVRFFKEPRTVSVGSDSDLTMINHYPHELEWADGEFSFKIKRRLADVEAAKQMNFLRLLAGLDKGFQAKGMEFPMEIILDSYRDTGRGLQIEGIDAKLQPAYDVIEQAKAAKAQAALQPPAQPAGAPAMGEAPSGPATALESMFGGGAASQPVDMGAMSALA